MRFWDSFWRASVQCLHPKVVALALLPLLLCAAAVVSAAWWGWEAAVDGVRRALEETALLAGLLRWLEQALGIGFRTVLAPVLVVALALPVVVMLNAWLVALFAGPALVRFVAGRRFASQLGSPAQRGLKAQAWALLCFGVALLALLMSLPLWLLPPLAWLLPALIWAWLAGQVFGFMALAQHASQAERRRLLLDSRWALMAMGVWAAAVMLLPLWLLAGHMATFIFAPWIALGLIALYTLGFVWCALWCAHYLLSALAQARQAAPPPDGASPSAIQPTSEAPAPAAALDHAP
jgi:hypothetical protein